MSGPNCATCKHFRPAVKAVTVYGYCEFPLPSWLEHTLLLGYRRVRTVDRPSGYVDCGTHSPKEPK